MKHLISILLSAILCATASAQTIKTLGYNTTNGQVVANTTNVLTFTNNVMFASGDVQLSGTQIIGNGITIDFDDGAISGPIALDTNSYIQFLGSSGATTRTNLGLGASNDVEFNTLQLGGSGQMSIRGTAGSIYFYNGVEVQNVLTIPADTDPVEINSQWNNAGVRSNLGLPLAALTNTSNVTMMRALAGSTNTNHPYSGSISVVGTNNTNTLVFSNGILTEVQ